MVSMVTAKGWRHYLHGCDCVARKRAGHLGDNGEWRGLPPQDGSYRPSVLGMISLVTARRKEVRWGWTCPSREIPEGGAASHASQLGHFNLS